MLFFDLVVWYYQSNGGNNLNQIAIQKGDEMIADISNHQFKKIMSNNRFFLPIRWDGDDFVQTLKILYKDYLQVIAQELKDPEEQELINKDIASINTICKKIVGSAKQYLNGFPAQAFNTFSSAMQKLIREPLAVYPKSVYDQFQALEYSNNDPLMLYRAARVVDNKPYSRRRIFHTPFNLRSKVSTSRYSIAGYPSLYLSTSLELCCQEIHANPFSDYVLASAFQLDRSIERSNINISVIELAVKPQDFLDQYSANSDRKRKIPRDVLEKQTTQNTYLLWYPLIAACSFIRVNKEDPFAAEYIIPQLLMQWVRQETSCDHNMLMGIRYFSCASVRASEMGLNYVFPTSGIPCAPRVPFCSVLSRSFRLTEPEYIHEFQNIQYCERELTKRQFDHIIRIHKNSRNE